MVTDDRDKALKGISGEAQERLHRHLANWLGLWPDHPSVSVVHSSYREQPGWDGGLRPFVGIVAPQITVISVASQWYEPIARAVEIGGLEELEATIAVITNRPGTTLRRGVFRYQQAIMAHDGWGQWIDPLDSATPVWLRPFNGDVLIALGEDGRYVAGVGRKRHDQFAQELAVVTEEAHRHRGYAKQLVSQAAERVYAEGAVATYLHRADNLGSAAVAEACGFFDRGWEIVSISNPRS